MVKASAALAAAVWLSMIAATPAQAQVKGPMPDRIIVDAKSSRAAALKDLAAGRGDLFDYAVAGPVFEALPPDEKAALETYAIRGSSYVDLLVNPYPDQAPYTAKGPDGGTLFNPFAIREVRYALNFLIDRKKIVDDILGGAGAPMFTPACEGQPNASRFAALSAALGFSAAGDETKALADIEAAMQRAAAADPRLAKAGAWWTYDGKVVTVKFLIRADDPSLRLPMGRSIADQIEKAGIKVERLELDRSSCSAIVNKTDPADCAWNLYTEAWGGAQTYEFWDGAVAQMYAPWASYMPGGGRAGQWNYENARLDALSRACFDYRVTDARDYWDKLLAAAKLGLEDSIRVFVASPTRYVCARKDRFSARMPAGPGDGVDAYSLYSADVKRGADGRATLRMSLYSKGPLFAAAWDPVGPDGFGDPNSSAIVKIVSDPEYGASPLSGAPFPMTAAWSGVKTGAIDFGVSPPEGGIRVPPNAVLWNARDRRWEHGINFVDLRGDGSVYDYVKVPPERDRAWSTATFSFKFGRWHDGRRMDLNDYRYALARPYDLCVQRGVDDKIYDDSYAASVSPILARIKGLVFNGNDSITVYGDSSNPMDPNALAALLCPSLMLGGSNDGAVVSWPIHEALKAMVAEGSASTTTWVFNDEGSGAEVDLLNPACVADIRAKLEELAARKAVPSCLAGHLSPAQAVSAYEKAIAFIDRHGNAIISNGGFLVDSYDARNNTMTLEAFRDKDYPFGRGWFKEIFQPGS